MALPSAFGLVLDAFGFFKQAHKLQCSLADIGCSLRNSTTASLPAFVALTFSNGLSSRKLSDGNNLSFGCKNPKKRKCLLVFFTKIIHYLTFQIKRVFLSFWNPPKICNKKGNNTAMVCRLPVLAHLRRHWPSG